MPARFKRTICPTCGAPKQRPSATAYVYCDYCGSLSDFDFAKACEKPLERPGPVYGTLVAQMKPELDDAVARRDLAAYRAVQTRLVDAYVDQCPSSMPPRVRDPKYRARYVAYMVEGAVATAFDARAKELEAAATAATLKLSFFQAAPGVVRVDPNAFEPFLRAVLAQQEHAATLQEAHGVYAMHPDGASAELQQRLSLSMFAQGWLPMLDEAQAIALLDRTKLRSEYLESEPATGDAAACGSCGAAVHVLPGAKRMVCDACGDALDVTGDRVKCGGCGAPLAPGEGVLRFACPGCRANVERVQMMSPG